MDKRKEENIRVMKSITEALFALMDEKSLADITVSEIVRKAGVARASFYRNYTSKEDVLVKLIRGILEKFRGDMDLTKDTIYTYENVLLSFQYFEEYRSYVLDLRKTGFISVLMEEMNSFHESIAGDMPYDSIDKYEMYMYIGALINTAVIWLQECDRVDAEKIAEYFFMRIAGRQPPAGSER